MRECLGEQKLMCEGKACKHSALICSMQAPGGGETTKYVTSDVVTPGLLWFLYMASGVTGEPECFYLPPAKARSPVS